MTDAQAMRERVAEGLIKEWLATIPGSCWTTKTDELKSRVTAALADAESRIIAACCERIDLMRQAALESADPKIRLETDIRDGLIGALDALDKAIRALKGEQP